MDSRHLPILIAVVGVGLVYLYWQLNKKNSRLEEQLYYLQAHLQRLTTSFMELEVERNEEHEQEGQPGRELEVVDEDEDEEKQPILERRVEEVELDYGYEQDSDVESEPDGVEQEMSSIREIDEEPTPAEDIVITKLSHCPHILQSGKNKGSSCGKPATDNGYCKHHLPPEPLH